MTHEHPELTSLAQAYFHQDWYEVSGDTWQAVVDHYCRDANTHERTELIAEIDDVLGRFVGRDSELRALLHRPIDLNYVLTDETARPWLIAVRDRVAATIADEPAP